MKNKWTNNRTLALLEDIKKYKYLWDPKEKDYKNKTKKFDRFKILSVKYQCTAEDIKKKWTNLLQVYRSCCRKVKHTTKSGAGQDEVYKPWFAYEFMNTFMADVYVPHGTSESMNEERENHRDSNVETLDEENMQNADKNENETTEINDTQESKNISSSPKNVETKKRKRQLQTTIDERAEEAYLIQKRKEATDKKQKDECDIFGELIAAKLKKLDNFTREYVMNDINNLMFRTIMNNTSYLQQSQFNNFHLSQEFINNSNLPQPPNISHSSLSSVETVASTPTNEFRTCSISSDTTDIIDL